MRRFAIHVSTDVEHNGSAGQCRKRRRNGRALHTFNHTEEKKRRHHACAGIARAHHRLRVTRFHEFCRNPNRRVPFFSCDLCRRLMHFHDLRGMVDRESRIIHSQTLEVLAQLDLIADENHFDA